MNPIFTVSNEKVLDGYWYDEFMDQFGNICEQHLADKRAKKFAFIIFDFHSEIHSVLKKSRRFYRIR